jgi:Cu/Ag efflux protein CusF
LEIYMRYLTILAIAVAAATAPIASAQKPEVAGGITTSPGKGKAVAMIKATATVETVDQATRMVTLKMPNGEIHGLVAGEEIRNLDKIKPGDKINVGYLEALAIELKKDGKAVVGRTETMKVDRAAKGETPGGGARREITAVADVVAVDAAGKKVSVKNGKGEIIDLNIADPEQLKLIKKGDQIQATYSQAVAVSLEPVKK